MPDSGNSVDQIQVGDQVAYRMNTGGLVLGLRGKVLAVFKTQDGKTIADVEWDSPGAPGRLSITNLTTI
jgi:hypothetical protein